MRLPEDLVADDIEILELVRTLTPEQRAHFAIFIHRLAQGAIPPEALAGLKSSKGLEGLVDD